MATFPGSGSSTSSVSPNTVTRNTTTNALEANGVEVSPYESTWAAFPTLVSTAYDGIHVRITDKHRDYRGVGGLLFRGGATWTIVEPQMYCAVEADRPSAVTYPGLRIFAADFGTAGGAHLTSNGTEYVQEREVVIHRDNVTSNVLILPALQPTLAAVSGGGTRLTLAAHGITAAIATTILPAAQLYVTTTGNGWTAGTWHTITSIVDINNIDIDTTYTGKTGVPTLAIAGGGSVVTMETIAIPPMTANGEIIIETLAVATATANNKNLTIKLDGITLFAPVFSNSTVGLYTDSRFRVSNRNSKSSQIGSLGNLSPLGSMGSTTSTPVVATVNTGSATSLTLNWAPTTVNERIQFDKITVLLRP